MKLKNIKKISILLLALTLVLTACGGNKEGVAATVNGVDIPMDEYVNQYKSTAQSIMMEYGEDYLKEESFDDPNKNMGEALREALMNYMVQMEIARQDAEEKGITVEDSEVEKQLNQTMELYGGEENFKKALEAQGIDENYYKDYTEQSLFMQKYYDALKKEFKPTDDELKDYYKENKEQYKTATASHILVEEEETAKDIKKQLDNGADFAELAKKHSIDESNKDNGGSLGSFTPGTMVPEFDKAVFQDMKPKTISDPIKTDFGYHIIKLDALEDSEFKDVKDQIQESVLNEKITEYTTGLEDKAKIDIYVDFAEDIPVEVPKAPESDDKAKKENAANNSSNEDKGKNSNNGDTAEAEKNSNSENEKTNE